MDWTAFLQSIGASSIISSAIVLMLKNYYAKKEKQEKDDDTLTKDVINLKKSRAKMENEIENINITMIKINDTLDTLTDANQATLRDRIIDMYNKYSKEEYMPIYARESLDHMYTAYHKLGGNGVIEDLIQKLYDLPTSLDDDKK